MSLINYPCTAGLNNALASAKNAGAILVACAGNGGIGDADVSCPGASTHTISIGATTFTDARASYSGTGNALEFVAPGHQVRTAIYNSAADSFTIFSGCSGATPVAAGIVSILRALGPELRTDPVRAILQATAEDLVGDPLEDLPGWDPYMGYGRVNLRAALEHFLAQTGAPEASGPIDLAVQVRPNPARGGVVVRFALPEVGWTNAAVYDVRGRLVQTLADGLHGAGEHDIRWDGTDRHGNAAAAGIYFVRLECEGRVVQRKVTLVR
jgi:subtilisin family serine protease